MENQTHQTNKISSPVRYHDRNFNCEAAKLQPGEYFVTDKQMVLVTVLGSCVAACLYDTRLNIGGMNHFMLPRRDHDPNSLVSAATRYGAHAMEILINQLLKMGAKRATLEAKIFGGANILRGFNGGSAGETNAHFITEYLQVEGIRIASNDLLSNDARKIYFFPATGRTLVKKIREFHNHTIVDRESEYGLRIRNLNICGDIELFSY
ncbi:MAG: chemoreceptor glutamine deamidase CheD [Betaproteobacteria bacterium]|nr:chemoreceptor glutamine deamidase CheD [Betaproteobacteria bacterium]